MAFVGFSPGPWLRSESFRRLRGTLPPHRPLCVAVPVRQLARVSLPVQPSLRTITHSIGSVAGMNPGAVRRSTGRAGLSKDASRQVEARPFRVALWGAHTRTREFIVGLGGAVARPPAALRCAVGRVEAGPDPWQQHVRSPGTNGRDRHVEHEPGFTI
jgi:hypothetical protein